MDFLRRSWPESDRAVRDVFLSALQGQPLCIIPSALRG
jgi:hypothetical protein